MRHWIAALMALVLAAPSEAAASVPVERARLECRFVHAVDHGRDNFISFYCAGAVDAQGAALPISVFAVDARTHPITILFLAETINHHGLIDWHPVLSVEYAAGSSANPPGCAAENCRLLTSFDSHPP